MKEIQATLAIRHRETFLKNYLRALLKGGILEQTNPDRPTSRSNAIVSRCMDALASMLGRKDPRLGSPPEGDTPNRPGGAA